MPAIPMYNKKIQAKNRYDGKAEEKQEDDRMKELNRKMEELYHSKRKDFGGKGLLYMAAILVVLGGLLWIPGKLEDLIFLKWTYWYLGIAFLDLAITAAISYLYVYGKDQRNTKTAFFSKTAYKCLLAISFVICIPLICFLKITKCVLEYRAKSLERLENWFIILAIDLSVIMVLCYYDLLGAEFLAEAIANGITNQCGYEIMSTPISIFLTLLIIKLEMDAVNWLILKIMSHYGMIKAKKISEDKAEQEKKKIMDDADYQKKTLWKFQLACLIILFAMEAITPDFLFAEQTDAMNVITMFTLIMLYLDKRKSWK